MGMTYSVRQARGVTVVDLSGKLRLGEAIASGGGRDLTLHELIRDLLKEGHKNLLLNLRDVPYVDSSGIGEFFSSFTTVQNQGGVLKLTNPNERVRNVLHLTKLNTVIDVMEDEAAAVQSFAKAGAA